MSISNDGKIIVIGLQSYNIKIINKNTGNTLYLGTDISGTDVSGSYLKNGAEMDTLIKGSYTNRTNIGTSRGLSPLDNDKDMPKIQRDFYNIGNYSWIDYRDYAKNRNPFEYGPSGGVPGFKLPYTYDKTDKNINYPSVSISGDGFVICVGYKGGYSISSDSGLTWTNMKSSAISENDHVTKIIMSYQGTFMDILISSNPIQLKFEPDNFRLSRNVYDTRYLIGESHNISVLFTSSYITNYKLITSTNSGVIFSNKQLNFNTLPLFY
jgi:hypothetical protein